MIETNAVLPIVIFVLEMKVELRDVRFAEKDMLLLYKGIKIFVKKKQKMLMKIVYI